MGGLHPTRRSLHARFREPPELPQARRRDRRHALRQQGPALRPHRRRLRARRLLRAVPARPHRARERRSSCAGTDCYGSAHRRGLPQEGRGRGLRRAPIVDYVACQPRRSQKRALDALRHLARPVRGLRPGAGAHVHAAPHRRGRAVACTSAAALQAALGPRASSTTRRRTSSSTAARCRGCCPVRGCKCEKAYADECDLGHQFDPEELIAPGLAASPAPAPELRPVDNWYFDLPAFANELARLMDEWDTRPAVCAPW